MKDQKPAKEPLFGIETNQAPSLPRVVEGIICSRLRIIQGCTAVAEFSARTYRAVRGGLPQAFPPCVTSSTVCPHLRVAS
jgi:hypothetical protein